MQAVINKVRSWNGYVIYTLIILTITLSWNYLVLTTPVYAFLLLSALSLVILSLKHKYIFSLKQMLVDLRFWWKLIVFSMVFHFLLGIVYVSLNSSQFFNLSSMIANLLNPRARIVQSFEEVLFRVGAFSLFLQVEALFFNERNIPRAIIAQGLLFGLCHLSKIKLATDSLDFMFSSLNVIWATAYGIFFGFIFSRSRNLLTTIVLHNLVPVQETLFFILIVSIFK